MKGNYEFVYVPREEPEVVVEEVVEEEIFEHYEPTVEEYESTYTAIYSDEQREEFSARVPHQIVKNDALIESIPEVIGKKLVMDEAMMRVRRAFETTFLGKERLDAAFGTSFKQRSR